MNFIEGEEALSPIFQDLSGHGTGIAGIIAGTGENDIDIINMSFGTTVCSQALKQAVSDAYAANILMVGAAGNDGGEVEYPAAFE